MTKQSPSLNQGKAAGASKLKLSSAFLAMALSFYCVATQAGERAEALALLARLLKEEQQRQAQLEQDEQETVKAENETQEDFEANIDGSVESMASVGVDADFMAELLSELDAESDYFFESDYSSASGGQVYFVAEKSAGLAAKAAAKVADAAKDTASGVVGDATDTVTGTVKDQASGAISAKMLAFIGLGGAAGAVALSDEGGGGGGGSIVEVRSYIEQLDELLVKDEMLNSNYVLSNDTETLLKQMFALDAHMEGVFVLQDVPVEFVAYMVEKMIFNGFHQDELRNDKHGDALLSFIVENTPPNGVDQVYQAKVANLMVQAYEVFSKVEHEALTITMADLENYYLLYYDKNYEIDGEDSGVDYVVELIELGDVSKNNPGKIEFQGVEYDVEFYEHSRPDQEGWSEDKLKLVNLSEDNSAAINEILNSGMMVAEVYHAINDFFREYQDDYGLQLQILGHENLLSFMTCELVPQSPCANNATTLDIAKAGFADYIALAFDDSNTQMLMEFLDVYDMHSLNKGQVGNVLINMVEWLDLFPGSELYPTEAELKAAQLQFSYAFTNILKEEVVEESLTDGEVRIKLSAWNELMDHHQIKTLEQIKLEDDSIQSCWDSNVSIYADQCVDWV